jgi:hypothetical protein
MNTEQTTKPLGKICEENYWSSERPSFERAAQAVATEVLNRLPGEWILLHEEEIIEIGDEKYSVGMWAPVSVNVLGKMVGGRIVRRRLSPVPSQQSQLGSSKEPESCPACNSLVGWLFAQNPDKTLNKARSECHSCGYTMDHVTPSPAPRAEWKHGMAGNQVQIKSSVQPAPWKLPEPPPSVEALLESEKQLIKGFRVCREERDAALARCETLRELADRSAAEQGQSVFLLSEAQKKRDEALALASEAEKQLADIQREFGRIQGTSAKSVVDRFLDLMRKLNEKDLPAGFESWESFLKYIDGIKARAVAAESELATARASVPVWVPCNRVMPTEKDANAHGRVLFGSLDSIAWSAPWNEVKNATHWMALPPLPVETEKGDGFEEWWKEMSEGNFWLNEIHKTASRKAWQAALRSKKPSLG